MLGLHYIPGQYGPQTPARNPLLCYYQSDSTPDLSTGLFVSRLNVVHPDGESAPFLRGVLTRSLQKVGLTFSEAYDIASTVRNQLASNEEASSDAITEAVLQILHEQSGPEMAERYRLAKTGPAWIRINEKDRDRMWFSRTVFRHRLETCGIPEALNERLVRDIHERLTRDYSRGIERHELHELSCEMVEKEAGTLFASYLDAWHRFRKSNRTLVILIGGTPGVGKSHAASLLASRLDITRTVSTDMFREVMRSLRPPEIAPELHYSSFEAWKAVENSPAKNYTAKTLKTGFNRQADEIEVAVHALLARSQHEQFSTIIEGVHIRPSIVEVLDLPPDAIVVPLLIAANRKKTLQTFFRGRAVSAPRRGRRHYLDNFSAIWDLQSLLMSEAENYDVPVVINETEGGHIMNRMFSIISSAVLEASPDPSG